MNQTFTYPSKTRLLWGGGLLLGPLFYGAWLLTAGLSGVVLGLTLLPELALLWLWLYALTILSQRATLTEQDLIYSRWLQTVRVSYADIFYARPKSSWPAGLILITNQGRLPLDKYLKNFETLYASLKERRPDLLTPYRPLPWQVSGHKTGFILGIFLGGLLLFWTMLASLLALTGQAFWPCLIVPPLFSISYLCIHHLLSQPYSFLFTPEKITRQTLWQTQSFDAVAIRAVYRDKSAIRAKYGRRAVQQVIIRFTGNQVLKISQDQIDYPFDEFYAILSDHYASATPVSLPWPREAAEVHHNTFAQGSINEFKWYFEQESRVPVSSVEDICAWLQGCAYIDDHKLFQKRDHWQHPSQFEQTRQGDCEDHALWAWRKLVELGLEAEFVVGNMKGDYHAWVMFRQNGQHYIFETVYKKQAMINPVDQVQASYRPDYSVDRHFVTYRYPRQDDTQQSGVAKAVNAR